MSPTSYPAAPAAGALVWPGSWFLQRMGYVQLSQPAPLAPFHPLKSPRQFVDSTECRPPASDYNFASDCQG